MALTPEETIMWQDRLTKAEQAYHDIATGNKPEEFVDQNGEKVRYTKATLSGLDSYIAKIKALLNPAAVLAARPRPIGFLF